MVRLAFYRMSSGMLLRCFISQSGGNGRGQSFLKASTKHTPSVFLRVVRVPTGE